MSNTKRKFNHDAAMVSVCALLGLICLSGLVMLSIYQPMVAVVIIIAVGVPVATGWICSIKGDSK